MFIDETKAKERIKYLDSQISKKQKDIHSLVKQLTSGTPAVQQTSAILDQATSKSASASSQTRDAKNDSKQGMIAQQVNIPRLNTQLSQLKVKIDNSRTYLDQSNHLSHIINSDISSLEERKNQAKSTLDLYTDIVELRGSIKMVKQTLAQVEAEEQDGADLGNLENLEMAAHFTTKSISLMQVIREQVQASPQCDENELLAKDIAGFKQLTD